MDVMVPWYVGGPLFGLCVAAMYLLNNQRLGASGGYLHVGKLLLRRPGVQLSRVWFFGGILVGGAGMAALSGRFGEGGYGHLAQVLPTSALVPTLLLSGALIGYGARFAGGCTSGHGLAGCSSLSQGSFVTSMTFFATAIVMTWALHLLSGGLL